VRRALHSPARQIATNAGAEASIVVGKALESKNAYYGYNAQTCGYGDMVTMDIVDPVKVVRTALQDAASVASLLITTEAMVASFRRRKPTAAACPAAAWAGWIFRSGLRSRYQIRNPGSDPGVFSSQSFKK
jgi:chaperonin GroEL